MSALNLRLQNEITNLFIIILLLLLSYKLLIGQIDVLRVEMNVLKLCNFKHFYGLQLSASMILLCCFLFAASCL